MAAVPDTVECSTWCWLRCVAKKMLKFVWLLKGTKNVGVAPNGLLCYLLLFYHAVRENIIIHKVK